MGPAEHSDSLSSEMEEKSACIEKAKSILLVAVVADDDDDDDDDGSIDSTTRIGSSGANSRAFVETLVGLQNSLQETLSKSLNTQQSIYSQFHRLRWPMEGERNERNGTNLDNERVLEVLRLEADLYRAMWLTCLILLSVINRANTKQHNRKRNRQEWEKDSIGDDGKNRTILLQRTIDQCRLLVRLLEEVGFETESNANNEWDEHIQKWTVDDGGDVGDDEESSSINILSFTKEQLEQEELELLNMAETPIPTVHTRIPKQQQQQQQDKKHPTLDSKNAIQAVTTRNHTQILARAQEEIEQLWSIDEVRTAQMKARELFLSETRTSK